MKNSFDKTNFSIKGRAVMKLEKLPSTHQNLNVALAECKFVHLLNGNVIATGEIMRALNSENLEANYHRTGEEDKDIRRVILNMNQLHYDGVTDSGYVFGETVHDYSELNN